MSAAVMFLEVLLALVLLAVLLAFVFLVLPSYRLYRSFLNQGVSCAPFKPFIGEILRLADYHRNDRGLAFYHDSVAKYGLIHAMTLGPTTRLTVDDPRYLSDVLSASHAVKFHKPDYARLVVGGLLGLQNVLMTEGAEHSAHRRMISPAFHHQNLVEMVELMVRETERHIDQWLHPTTGKAEFDLARTMSSLTLSIIAACAFGAGFNSIPNAHTVMYNGLEKGQKISQRRLLTTVELIPGVRSLPFFGKTERDENRAVMRRLVDVVVAERREGKTSSLREGHHDLLDLLLNAKDEETGRTFTATEVRDNAMGHETTSNLMTYALFVLANRPALWQECLDEVLSVCGDSPPSHTHLSQLPLIDAVLNETLRFFQPVPMIAREVHTAATIGHNTGRPIHLPKGAVAYIHICVIHRLKAYWGENANEFDHTRWMKEKKPYTHPYAFLPFSSGPRNCVGSNFALIEARVMLILILQRCSMQVVEGGRLDTNGWPIPQVAVTLRPKYSIYVRIQPRLREERKER